MTRDKVKTCSYFDEWINYDQEVIQEIENEIESNLLAPYGKVQATYDLCRKYLDRIVMRYSRGDNTDDLRENLESLLTAREQLKSACDALPKSEQNNRIQYERLSFDNYLEFFWWLSFSVCLGMNKTHLDRVLALVDNAGQDALLDRIAAMIGDTERKVNSNLLFPKQYSLLLKTLDAPSDERPELIKAFLDGWYRKNENVAAWHNSHQDEDAGYVGYWCFEAALIVKLLGIDDTTFRGNIYYPADLVHSG